MNKNEYKIGDRIMIVHMDGEPNYDGRTGYITSIDDYGQLHGTWGYLAVVPKIDDIEIINHPFT